MGVLITERAQSVLPHRSRILKEVNEGVSDTLRGLGFLNLAFLRDDLGLFLLTLAPQWG